MLNEPTMEKLYELRLSVMAEAWTAQQKDAAISALSFDERMALLVEAEHMARDNRKLRRLLKDAELRIPSHFYFVFFIFFSFLLFYLVFVGLFFF
jgi:hypothetical protein